MESKCGGGRQNGGRLGDVTEAGRPVFLGLQVILQILRFGGHFCRDHGSSAPPPSAETSICLTELGIKPLFKRLKPLIKNIIKGEGGISRVLLSGKFKQWFNER